MTKKNYKQLLYNFDKKFFHDILECPIEISEKIFYDKLSMWIEEAQWYRTIEQIRHKFYKNFNQEVYLEALRRGFDNDYNY